MPFLQAPAGAQRILGGWRWSGWPLCCGRSWWWCSRRMTKRSSLASLGRGRRGASERRVQSRSTPSEAKPGSLWTCGPAPNPAATPRVCYRPPDCTRGSPHRWGVSSMIAWTFSMNSLVRVFLAVSSALGFRSTTCKWSSDALNRPDLHFEGASNGPVVISWIGREYELYSGAYPTSVVEHYHFQTW